MSEIRTRRDLERADDFEIVRFFREATCFGYFDNDVEDKDRFCGKITNILIDETSRRNFMKYGYKTVSSEEFDIKMLKS